MVKQLTTTCCIVGGGPAGMMVGYLLARAGIDVVVLEKYPDFFNDFRGDTIHPSTIQIMYELGLLDEFLAVPHQEYEHLMATYNNIEFELADFTHLKVAKPVLGVMPQWDFLSFIAQQAAQYKTFRVMMEAEVKELLWQKDTVVGVRTTTPEGELEINASLVIGTDGRHSIVRQLAKLNVLSTETPVDMLWFRISKKESDTGSIAGRFANGSFKILINQGEYMILIDRDNYWQGGYLIEKNGFDKLKEMGLDAFKKEFVIVAPFLHDRLEELKSWDDLKLLSITVDRLEKWYCDGLLCIGDAAHAMSPIGGVGINLAIQDAVATANILYPFLKDGKTMNGEVLKLVQQRRAFPARVIQKLQAAIHWGVVHDRTNKSNTGARLPWPFAMVKIFPVLRRIPAYLVGMGVRAEHVGTPDSWKVKD